MMILALSGFVAAAVGLSSVSEGERGIPPGTPVPSGATLRRGMPPKERDDREAVGIPEVFGCNFVFLIVEPDRAFRVFKPTRGTYTMWLVSKSPNRWPIR